MTVAFLFEPGRDKEYPKFVLESEDGAYREELSPKDDLVKGDAYLQLRFQGLQAGKRYTLTRHVDSAYSHAVFERLAYPEIVDQPRAELDALEEAQYARSSRATAKQRDESSREGDEA